ncbi:MAG: hypothetical protein ACRDHK_15805 [Actinomycetota bacterium]
MTSPRRESTDRGDWREEADERLARWIRLACPTCGISVDILDMPSVIA